LNQSQSYAADGSVNLSGKVGKIERRFRESRCLADFSLGTVQLAGISVAQRRSLQSCLQTLSNILSISSFASFAIASSR
jgi:hypothetical protein